MTTIAIDQLSNEELAAETRRVAGEERRSMAALISLLVEVERRGPYLALGYPSMFVYCVRALHLSEQAGYSRITAARASRRFPQVLVLLAEGALTLSSVGLLAPHLTDVTVEPMLESARFKTTRDVERLIAALHPQPDIPSSVRVVPQSRLTELPTEVRAESVAAAPDRSVAVPPRPARPVVAPIAPTRYYLKLTIGQETHDKLERIRALLRHAVPDGDLETIVDKALTLLLKDAERTKYASAQRPRSAETAKRTGRHVPAATRRAVWSRDEGQCAFRGVEGRCGERGFLEFHHLVPFAAGGLTTVENLQLRCRAHNQHEANLFFDVGASP